jgi:hypothetical protein
MYKLRLWAVAVLLVILSISFPVYAADGVAQLQIHTQYPFVRVQIIGINQNDDVIDHTWLFDSTENRTVFTTWDWWWRIKYFCGFLECLFGEYPEDPSPYVWVTYIDGHLENQKCTNTDIATIAQVSSCEFTYTGPGDSDPTDPDTDPTDPDTNPPIGNINPYITALAITPASTAEGSVWEPLPVQLQVGVHNPNNQALALYIGFSDGYNNEATPILATCRSVSVTTTQSVQISTQLPAILSAQQKTYSVWAILARNAPSSSCTPNTTSRIDRVLQVYSVNWVIRDSDGDALLDVWERSGYDENLDGTIDVPLPEWGANVNRKDIFVYVDWLAAENHNHRPSAVALDLVTRSFANQGIDLHIQWGNAIPETTERIILGSGTYDWTEFDSIKNSSDGFPPAYQRVAHYALFAHSITQLCGYSGISRDIPASDFIVSLGGWYRNDDRVDPPGLDKCNSSGSANGSDYQQAGTFMHELGHNLGLRHGGSDDIGYKPNYLSIMNYLFQFRGLLRVNSSGNRYEGDFDYSRFNTPDLNEISLNENTGITGGDILDTYRTRGWRSIDNTYGIMFPSNAPINWNWNYDTNGLRLIDSGTIRANINGDSYSNQNLDTWNDWARLIFNGGSVGATGVSGNELPIETPLEEMTPEDAVRIQILRNVDVDILPGNNQNPRNLGSNGTTLAAIFSTLDFDATRIDPSTIRMSGARIRQRGNEQYMVTLRDANHDGWTDFTFHYETNEMELGSRSNEVELSGEAYEGRLLILGEETIRVVPATNNSNSTTNANTSAVQINRQMNKNSRTPLIIDITALLATDGVDNLSEILEMSPSHGQVTLNEDGRSIAYTPQRGYAGFDHFRLSLNDIHVFVEVDIR